MIAVRLISHWLRGSGFSRSPLWAHGRKAFDTFLFFFFFFLDRTTKRTRIGRLNGRIYEVGFLFSPFSFFSMIGSGVSGGGLFTLFCDCSFWRLLVDYISARMLENTRMSTEREEGERGLIQIGLIPKIGNLKKMAEGVITVATKRACPGCWICGYAVGPLLVFGLFVWGDYIASY